MNKEKKDALTLSCEKLADIIDNPDSLCYIDFLDCSIENTEEMINYMKNHFQEKADIPDGWDVVKEIYRQFPHSDDQADGETQEFIKRKLQEAGIEVR